MLLRYNNLNCNKLLYRYSRQFNTYDIFKKLKDSSASEDNTDNNDKDKRKPSQKVTKLVDEILNLTLIEAADLCNLCQEKLSTNLNNVNSNRVPFPHPYTFFQNTGFNPNFVNQSPATPQPTPNTTSTATPTATTPGDASTPAAEAATADKSKEDKPKSLKLVGYNKDKKIEIIKAVRTILNINLRESKELIESYPKVIKKNLKKDELEKLSKMITDAGGEVEVE